MNLLSMLPLSAFAAARAIEVRQGVNGNVLELSRIGQFHSTSNAVESQRVIELPQSKALIALWEERTTAGERLPFYAISLDGDRIWRVQQTSYELLLRQEKFDPQVRLPFVRGLLGSNESNGIYIVQFVTQPLEEYRDQIRQLGGSVYNYLANHAYIVKLTAEARQRIEKLPFVRWVGAYLPAYRFEDALLTQLARKEGEFTPARYNIQLFERGPFPQQLVKNRITTLGGEVNSAQPEGFLMQVTLTGAQLRQIATWPEILFIDRRGDPENDYDLAREIGGANFLEAVAGFTGQGVRGELLDDGVRTTHVDFQANPVLWHGPPGLGFHGTNTFGIVFSTGTGDPRARGFLPDGQGIAARYSVAGFNRYTHTAELIQDPYFAVFQSNSWGDPQTMEYTTISAQFDDILFINDILVTQSQSNLGNRSSRPQAWAKNVVSVGGIHHLGTLTMEDDCWRGPGPCGANGAASIGPAADGRIKPDLAHFYDLVFTTNASSDTSYEQFCCTSAATPLVAGHFGLFFQMWHNGIFGNPTAETVFASRPHMTTAKAMLINTAKQWNFSGREHDLTRTHQGWGLPDLRNLYDLRNQMLIVDETDVLQNMKSTAYAVTVTTGGPPLKATLVYKDPMGTTSSSQHRINDLSLKLTSPSGDVYWGNNGLLDGMWSVPGGEPDTKNTVENVFIETPEPGGWTVEVIASEINQDSHLQTPEIDADYALVVSGIVR